MMLASTIDFFANAESPCLGPNIDCRYPMDKSSIRGGFFFSHKLPHYSIQLNI